MSGSYALSLPQDVLTKLTDDLFRHVVSGISTIRDLSYAMGLARSQTRSLLEVLITNGLVDTRVGGDHCPVFLPHIRKPATRPGDIDALCELLKDGPLEIEDARDRLCIASAIRFDALVERSIQYGMVERLRTYLRLRGDQRSPLTFDQFLRKACSGGVETRGQKFFSREMSGGHDDDGAGVEA